MCHGEIQFPQESKSEPAILEFGKEMPHRGGIFKVPDAIWSPATSVASLSSTCGSQHLFAPNHNMSQARYDRILQDWRADISCSKDEVRGSFSVFVFLGDIPPDPTLWLADPALVGTFDVVAHYDEASNPTVNGCIHLNRAILRITRQQSLEDHIVLPLLRHKLNWGVQTVRNQSHSHLVLRFLRKVDGEIVGFERIPSLQILVQRTPIISPIGGLPSEGRPVYFYDVTRGRPGGYHGRQS